MMHTTQLSRSKKGGYYALGRVIINEGVLLYYQEYHSGMVANYLTNKPQITFNLAWPNFGGG